MTCCRAPRKNSSPRRECDHFTGKQRDSESGLDDFDARYYSSQWGRFISADWSAVPAPVPYANLTNPQTLNLYAIVADNPGAFADLDGHTAASPPPPPGSEFISNAEMDSYFLMDDGQPPPQADPQVATQEQRQQAAQPDTTQSTAQDANADRRAEIAATARADEGDTSMPYTPGHPTCELFVQREIAKSGAPKPELKKADGTTGAPGAAEWAGSKIPNWRFLKPGEKPQPGDVAAWPFHYSDATGHSGIVISVDKNGRVTAMAAHATIIGKDYSFNPSPQHPVVTYRRYTGD